MGSWKPSQLLQSRHHCSFYVLPPEGGMTWAKQLSSKILPGNTGDITAEMHRELQEAKPKAHITHHTGPNIQRKGTPAPCPTASPATLHPSTALSEGSKAGACWREDFALGLPSTWMSAMNGCPTSSVRLDLLITELPYVHSSFSTPSSRCVDRPNHILLTRYSKLTSGQTGKVAVEVKDPLR